MRYLEAYALKSVGCHSGSVTCYQLKPFLEVLGFAKVTGKMGDLQIVGPAGRT
jgi:hypothetical protein